MKAAFYKETGEARRVLRVGELDTPRPSAGEVRVRMIASGVNPADVKARAGRSFSVMPFPAIVPHHDGVGTIDEVGEGVLRSRVGERVWIWNGQFGRAFGTAAEFIVVPDAQAVLLPDGVTAQQGACLGIPAQTGYRAATFGQDLEGKTVLVSGGGGAVGSYAVQFAKLKGATVIATVGSVARATRALSAGAVQIINYKTEDVAKRVQELTGGRGVDRLVEVEFGMNAPNIASLLRPDGTVYVYGSAKDMQPTINVQQLMMHGVTMHFRSVFKIPLPERQAAIRDITSMLEAGVLQNEVAKEFPLEEIASAHEAVENGKEIGNVVVNIG